ncbi:Tetraspanin family [Popillia japonica]|uniref:Tetraspanin family n=1 Tax=Popillia japonica TaxID=7064 RepID=A0AAW1JCA0_POPJA
MKNYSKDSNIKADIDLMQIENDCCGSNNYTDWYDIKWYDANLINTEAFPQLKGETPFSCCSIQSVYPCIHHGVEVASDAYIYRKNSNISVSITGCHSVIIKAKRTAGWSLVLRTLLLLILQLAVLCGLRLIQTGHSERKGFDREDKVYTCWIIGFYAGRSRFKPPPPPLKSPETDDEKVEVNDK